jgi:predicted ester cyclase
MSAQENKILSNRVAQAISEGDLEALDELMAPELADEFKRDVAEIRRAFPDYAGTNVEQIAEGEEVANRFVFLGTHLGEFEGVNPTGKRVERHELVAFIPPFLGADGTNRTGRAHYYRAGEGCLAWLPPTARFSPVGVVLKFSTTVCGSRRTLSVSVRPPESVAVRVSSR